MVCNEICKKYAFIRTGKESFYANGASRCNGKCYEWIKWDGLFCPCCGVRLRKNPRNKTGKLNQSKIAVSRITITD